MKNTESLNSDASIQNLDIDSTLSDNSRVSNNRLREQDIRHITLSDVDVSSYTNITYDIYAESSIGGREENQDFYSAIETPYGLLLMVCDGMGGANGGATASQLAVKSIIERLESHPPYTTPSELLHDVIEHSNLVVYQRSVSDPQLTGMGTTIVALLLSDQKATVAHVGDSRLYQIRDKRRIFRTFDHSMVFELVRRGSLTEEEARLSAGSNVILQALGIKPTVDNIEITDDITYKKGDRFLLCTDGVCGAVQENQVLSLAVIDKSVKSSVTKLISTINEVGVASGNEHDNLTAIILEVKSNSTLKEKTSHLWLYISIVVALFLILVGVAAWHFNLMDMIK